MSTSWIPFDTGAGAGSVFSTGGMATNLLLVSAAGTKTLIMRASESKRIVSIYKLLVYRARIKVAVLVKLRKV